ncbi:MAG: hypothetical protein N2449_04035 [Bacteroidales bacterium]|nr:hypothetical protein [Bacteroidales bacterium]
MKHLIIAIFSSLILSTNLLKAQFICDSIEYHNDTSVILKQAYFQLNFNTFLRNNEYFNELYDGITFIGTNVNPYLSYNPSKKITLSAGWYCRLFNGREKFYINQLFYRLIYRISPTFRMIFGNIYGYDFHSLPEPLYSTDYFYFTKPENGLQFLLNTQRISNDLWLNWEKFILPGDHFKEEFIIGNASRIYLTNKYNPSRVSIPLNFIAKHKGGQVETSTFPLQTYFNWSAGTDYSYTIHNNTFGICAQYIQFNDVSDYKILQYTDGYGLYSNLYVQLKHWEIISGYWFGEYYFSPIGEPLYQSLSKKYVNYQEPQKNLIIFKLRYKYFETNRIPLYVQFESYWDYQRNYFDFSYSFIFKISERFALMKSITFE